MLTTRFSFALGLVLLTACSDADTPAPSDPEPDPVAERVRAYLDELETRGFSGVVLVDHFGVVTSEGMGLADRDAGVEITPETVFDIGSITKQFTAAAILRLEMDGLLSVGDPLSAHLPGLPADKQVITLHQLLTHTAGLVGDLGTDYEAVDRATYLDRFASTPLFAAPGEIHEYSNVGYSILAAIVEQVTETSYEQYLAEALFAPAQMEQTGYTLPSWNDASIAVGYAEGAVFGRPNEQPWADDGPYWNLRGNGGLMSTAGDMHRWHEALVGDAILDAAAKDKLYGAHTPEGPGSETFYGYGWALFPTLFDSTLVTHNGGNGIFFADFLRFLAEDVTIFLATNAMEESFDAVAFELADEVFAEPAVDPALYGGGEEEPSCGPESEAYLDSLPELAALPSTDAGATAQLLLDLMLEGGDEAALLDFAENNVAEALLESLGNPTPEQLVLGMQQIQAELDGLVIDKLSEESDLAFHVTLAGGEVPVILTIVLDETTSTKVTCFEIMYF